MNSFDNVSVRPTDAKLEERQNKLADVIMEIKSHEKIMNPQLMIKEMQRQGYPEYTRMMLYTDQTTLNSKNNYIRNFLPNYSAYQEEIKEDLDYMMNEAKRLFKHNWEIVRVYEHENKHGKFTNVTTTTGEGKIKVELLGVMTKIVDLKQKHALGQNIQIGAVIIGKELQDKRNQIKILQAKVAEERQIPK